jgi:4-hydroxybenzoate polyprenyltransferase
MTFRLLHRSALPLRQTLRQRLFPLPTVRISRARKHPAGSHCFTRIRTLSTTPPPSTEKQKTISSSETSDPPILTWIDDYLPTRVQPYARLARIDKPIGTWLLLWPCAWSTAIATEMGHLPDPKLLGLFTAGAFIMRGAGCTINDLWDQDIDAKVSRTATRPLAAGDLTTSQAIGFLALQLSAGLGVLLSLPHLEYCFVWGASSLPLVVAYPLMKRYTDYPQLVLGLTFNWGAWMGWAATYGSMDYSIIAPLYLSGVTWTLVYDTIYAHQDAKEDAKLGLKSTALTFGSDEQQQKRILHGLAALTYLQWLLVGYNCSIIDDPANALSLLPYALGVSSAYGHLVWQIQTAELDNPQNVSERFRSNTTVGAIVFGSIVAGKLL